MLTALSATILTFLVLVSSAFAQDAVPSKPAEPTERLSDAAIVTAIIAASIAAYRARGPGPCACPEDLDRVGNRCGRRSAHSRPGGWVVYCYPTDVTPEMIASYRAARVNRVQGLK